MILTVSNLKTHILYEDSDIKQCPKIKKLIEQKLRVRADGYKYNNAYKSGYWDGYKSLLSKDNLFLTGFLPAVIKVCAEAGVGYTLVDDRKNKVVFKSKLDIEVKNPEGFVLREYQQRVLTKTINTAVSGLRFPRGIWNLAVNSGKMIILTALAHNVVNPKVLLIIDRQANFKQNVEWFKNIFNTPTVQGSKFDFTGTFVVAMAKSLKNLIKKPSVRKELQSFNIVCCDEAHRAASATYVTIHENLDPYIKINMSGTTLDVKSVERKLRLIGLGGGLIDTVTEKDLEDWEVSLKTNVFIHLIREGKQAGFLHYHEAYNLYVINSKERVRKMYEIIGNRQNKLGRPMS